MGQHASTLQQEGGGENGQPRIPGMFTKNQTGDEYHNMKKMESSQKSGSELYKYLVENKMMSTDIGVPVSAPSCNPQTVTTNGSTSVGPSATSSSTPSRRTSVVQEESSNQDVVSTGNSRVNSPCSSDSSGSVHHLGPKKQFLLGLIKSPSDNNSEPERSSTPSSQQESKPSPSQFTHPGQFITEALTGHILHNGTTKVEPKQERYPNGMFDLRSCIDDIIDSPSIRTHLLSSDPDGKPGGQHKGDILSRLVASEVKDTQNGKQAEQKSYPPPQRKSSASPPNPAEKRPSTETRQPAAKKQAGENPPEQRHPPQSDETTAQLFSGRGQFQKHVHQSPKGPTIDGAYAQENKQSEVRIIEFHAVKAEMVFCSCLFATDNLYFCYECLPSTSAHPNSYAVERIYLFLLLNIFFVGINT